MRTLARYKVTLVFSVVFILFFVAFHQFRWKGKTNEEWKHILWSDARGYYYYLPSLFIYDDLDHQPFDPLYTVVNPEGKLVNRYYVGTAALELPFFGIACLHAQLSGEPVDGKSYPFAFWIGIAPLVYVLLGLYFLYRLLQGFGLPENPALFLVVVAAFGTNLFYYTVYKGNFSHAFSFFAITAFYFLLVKSIREKENLGLIFLIGCAAVFVVLIRPVNLLAFLFVPFFFSDFSAFIHWLKKSVFQIKPLVVLFLAFFPLVFFQLFVWYKQSGHWIQWSYNQEGFYFASPKFILQLFSFDQGLFIYNPVFFISVISLFFLWKTNRYKFLTALLFLLPCVYITSAWWSPTYGNSFSIRPYTDYTTVFILFIGLVLQTGVLMRFIKIVLVLAALLNILFSYQFYAEIIPGTGMNAQRFFQVFGKTGVKYRNCFGGMYDLPPFAPNGFETVFTYKKQLNSAGENCEANEFPMGTTMVYPNDKEHVRHVWYKVYLDYNIPLEKEMNEALVVFDVQDTVNNSRVYYYAFRMKDFRFEKNGEWHENCFTVWFPNLIHGGNRIGIYVWNKNKEAVLIKRFEVEACLPKW